MGSFALELLLCVLAFGFGYAANQGGTCLVVAAHAGTVRLVDRLVSEGLIERREHSTDGRARSLYLTPTGKVASDEVLASRDQVIAEGLSILNPDELKTLSDIAERVLRNRLENLEQSYRICRLCCYEGCTNCPVDAELHERGVDREKNDDA